MTESLASTQASEAAGERPDIQKKVFGRWINWKLQQGGFAEHLITDLYFDLQNGESLLDLVSVLTHKDIKREQVHMCIPTFKTLKYSQVCISFREVYECTSYAT